MQRILPILIIFILATFGVSPSARAKAPVYPCRIVGQYPHNPQSSTQGLFYHQGKFYESSGGFGESFVAIVDPATGKQLRVVPTQGKYFAEGITHHQNRLFMLTWQSGTGFIRSMDTLAPLDEFSYRQPGTSTEGWGIAHDGERFILSTGSARLHFLRSDDLTLSHTLLVRDGAHPVRLLNELEYVGGMVLASIWKSDKIAVIDPASGRVEAWIDLAPLRRHIAPSSGVANGIAYDAETGRLFVTGKHWDKLFEIAVDEVLWRQPVMDGQ